MSESKSVSQRRTAQSVVAQFCQHAVNRNCEALFGVESSIGDHLLDFHNALGAHFWKSSQLRKMSRMFLGVIGQLASDRPNIGTRCD